MADVPHNDNPGSEASLKLYVDRISQPARAVLILCKICNIPVKEEDVPLRRGAHKRYPFAKLPRQKLNRYSQLNPAQQVPFLEELNTDGSSFLLPESTAIIRYLCDRFGVDEKLYPRNDIRARAKVDALLAWYGSNLRFGVSRTILQLYFSKELGLPRAAELEQEAIAKLGQSADFLEFHLLPDGAFLLGFQFPTAADLLCACEIEQLRILDALGSGHGLLSLLQDRPRLRDWLRRVEDSFGEPYASVHGALHGLLQHLRKKAAAKSISRSGAQEALVPAASNVRARL